MIVNFFTQEMTIADLPSKFCNIYADKYQGKFYNPETTFNMIDVLEMTIEKQEAMIYDPYFIMVGLFCRWETPFELFWDDLKVFLKAEIGVIEDAVELDMSVMANRKTLFDMIPRSFIGKEMRLKLVEIIKEKYVNSNNI